jgi:hypothetical protein
MGVVKSTNLVPFHGTRPAVSPRALRTGGDRLLGRHRATARGHRILLSVTAPLTAGVVWTLFAAPGATIRTSPLVRFLVELTVFTAATTGRLRRGRLVLAAVLGLCYAVNRTLIAVWDQ